jgi:putative sterol carrier protein
VDTPLVDPAEFARLVREATDAQLAAGFAANRELILSEAFRRMPEHLDSDRAADVDAVVEWRILGREDGGHDTFQLVIASGNCRLELGRVEQPTVIYEIAPIDFIRLITGNASGPKLFLFGRLKVRGNLLLAARMPALFTTPGAQQ